MSFGFSVGDFFAISRLVADIVNSLNDASGARPEFRGLLKELHILQELLLRLENFQSSSQSHSPNMHPIEFAALSCRIPLEEFLNKMGKHSNGLVEGARVSSFRGGLDKLKWSFGTGQKETVAKLQNYLSVHMSTIGVLLLEDGTQTASLTMEKLDDAHHQLEEVRQAVTDTGDNVADQRAAVREVHSMLSRIFNVFGGDALSGWNALAEKVSSISATVLKVYEAVLDIKAAIDLRWSRSLVLEDALGETFPVPVEYNFHMLQAVIVARFKTLPGSRDVALGNYELFKTEDSSMHARTGGVLP